MWDCLDLLLTIVGVGAWRVHSMPMTLTRVSLGTESTYDRETEELGLPVNFIVDQLFLIGEQYGQVSGAVKYWAEATTAGPLDFGFRRKVTYLVLKPGGALSNLQKKGGLTWPAKTVCFFS